MDSKQKQTFLTPISDVGGTAGYAGISATSDTSKVAQAASKYLKDSLLLGKLSDHVYELLLEDMRSHRERVNNYSLVRWL